MFSVHAKSWCCWMLLLCAAVIYDDDKWITRIFQKIKMLLSLLSYHIMSTNSAFWSHWSIINLFFLLLLLEIELFCVIVNTNTHTHARTHAQCSSLHCSIRRIYAVRSHFARYVHIILDKTYIGIHSYCLCMCVCAAISFITSFSIVLCSRVSRSSLFFSSVLSS